MGKTAEYYRTYNEKHREQINANSRLRYAVRHNKFAHPDVAKTRRAVFMAALEEVDADIQTEISNMLDAMIAFFMQNGLGQFAAENQAVEFLSACVWKGVNVPRKQLRQMSFTMTAAQAGD